MFRLPSAGRNSIVRWGSCGMLALFVAFGCSGEAGAQTKEKQDTGKRILIPDFGVRLKKKKAGTGDGQISLGWNNKNDLDLHVYCPSGEHIYYGHKKSRCRGFLDVDMNVQYRSASAKPIENVFWPTEKAPEGRYKIYVHHYRNHGFGDCKDPTEFSVRLNTLGDITTIDGAVIHGDAVFGRILVHEFVLKNGKITHQPVKFAKPRAAKTLFTAKGVLSANSQRFKGNPYVAYQGKLIEGRTYQIDLISAQFDTYLYVRHKGVVVASDDDGNGLNSRLIFRPRQTGTYELLASSFNAAARGNFVLTIVER